MAAVEYNHQTGTYKQNHEPDTSGRMDKNCNYAFMGMYSEFLIYLALWSVNCFAMNINSKKKTSPNKTITQLSFSFPK